MRSSKPGGSAAGGRRLPLPDRGCPLRARPGRRAGGEPGRARRRGVRDRRLARDPGGGGGRHRERGDLPGAVPLAERAGAAGVELVVSDDHAGLNAAAERHFQGAWQQRCQVHFARNLLGMVGHAGRGLGEDLRAIFAAAAQGRRLRSPPRWPRWRRKTLRGRRAPGRARGGCLSCLAFPEPHRRRIRTTNGLERLNQELKRRTRVVRIFPNPEACLRLVTALAVEQSEEWVTGRRYLDMRELEERRGKSGEPRRWRSWTLGEEPSLEEFTEISRNPP